MSRLVSLVVVPCALLLMEFKAQSVPARRHTLSVQLVHAVKRRDSTHVKRLLRLGANPDARDDAGRVLWRRIGAQKVQVRDDKTGSCVWTTRGKANSMKPFLGPTVLMIAARQSDLGTARVLLDAGANRNALGTDFLATQGDARDINTEWRCTPLAEAMLAGSPSMMRLLLRRGANVNAPDSDGVTPRLLLENMMPTDSWTSIQKRNYDSLLSVLRAYGVHR